jgi:hypothetical protein
MAKMDDGKTRRAGERDTGFGASGIPTFDPLFQASSRFVETWMAVSSEIFEFGKSRLDRSIEMGRAIAQSTSLNEAIDLQAKFTRSTVQEYLSEANKLADLGTRSLMDGFSTLQHTAPEVSADRAEAAE